jgi:hypothetical protein
MISKSLDIDDGRGVHQIRHQSAFDLGATFAANEQFGLAIPVHERIVAGASTMEA